MIGSGRHRFRVLLLAAAEAASSLLVVAGASDAGDAQFLDEQWSTRDRPCQRDCDAARRRRGATRRWGDRFGGADRRCRAVRPEQRLLARDREPAGRGLRRDGDAARRWRRVDRGRGLDGRCPRFIGRTLRPAFRDVSGNGIAARARSGARRQRCSSNGEVLIAGGTTTGGAPLATAALYNPAYRHLHRYRLTYPCRHACGRRAPTGRQGSDRRRDEGEWQSDAHRSALQPG